MIYDPMYLKINHYIMSYMGGGLTGRMILVYFSYLYDNIIAIQTILEHIRLESLN